MLHKQISVFIENKRGRLAGITKVLGDNGINMSALCVADTADYGIMRVIVDKPDLAEKVLKNEGYAVNITEVIAVYVEDRPGGLAEALRILDEYDINIEYMYHLIQKNERKAAVIIRVDNPAAAIDKLITSPLHVISQADLTGTAEEGDG